MMYVTLNSNEDIYKIEEIVKDTFVYIPNRNFVFKNDIINFPIFPNDLSTIFLYKNPFEKEIEIKFLFPMNEILTNYKEKPLKFIEKFFNSKENNSFYYYLHNELNLIEELKGNVLISSLDFSVFEISIKMLHNKRDKLFYVIQQLFGFIDLIENKGIDKNIYERIKRNSKLNFMFDDEFSPEKEDLTKNLRYFKKFINFQKKKKTFINKK